MLDHLIDPDPETPTLEEFTREKLYYEALERCEHAGYDCKEAVMIARSRLEEEPIGWEEWEDVLKLSNLHAAAMAGTEREWNREWSMEQENFRDQGE